MNLSTASYFTFLPLILYTTGRFFSYNAQRALRLYMMVMMVAMTVLSITDWALYENWGSKINGRALWYLQFPGAMAGSAMSISHLKFILAGIAVCLPFVWFGYNRLWTEPRITAPRLHIAGIFIVLSALLFVVLRGGISGRPLGKHQSYYSKYPALNYAAVNGFWNFFDIVSHYKPQGNPYHFYSETALAEKLAQFRQQKDTGTYTRYCHTQKPNILFVYLESWGADVVGCLGGMKGITPGLDRLAGEGILFTQFYSTGFRTEQGLMATLSGFPAQAQVYPMEEMERFENYPNLIKLLDSAGYYTSYFTGGNPDFANTRTYLTSSGIRSVHDELLFKAKKRSAWGALDEETFDWVYHTVSRQPQPFFTSMVTLTSHEWFEAPVARYFRDKDPVSAAYKNTVHYTDSCLLDFINKAKKTSWYANTLIVVMADHACTYPLGRQIQDPERYHVPMILLGGALNDSLRGTKIEIATGHLNIPAIMCNETGIGSASFPLAFHPEAFPGGRAYFVYDHGLGVISRSAKLVYDVNLSQPVLNKNTGTETSLMEFGTLLMQGSAHLKSSYQVNKQKGSYPE